MWNSHESIFTPIFHDYWRLLNCFDSYVFSRVVAVASPAYDLGIRPQSHNRQYRPQLYMTGKKQRQNAECLVKSRDRPLATVWLQRRIRIREDNDWWFDIEKNQNCIQAVYSTILETKLIESCSNCICVFKLLMSLNKDIILFR